VTIPDTAAHGPDELADRPVLIVGSHRADIDIVRGQLQPPFRNVYSADTIEQGAKLFSAHRPTVLLLCFDPCAETANAYVSLLRQTNVTERFRHQAMVVCDGTQVRAAFNLALAGVVDDAAVYRPTQAAELLQLRVRLAMKRAEAVSRAEGLSALVSGLQDGMIHLDDAWRAAQSKSETMKEESLQECARLVERIGVGQRSGPGASSVPRSVPSVPEVERALSAHSGHLGASFDNLGQHLEHSYHQHVVPLHERVRASVRAATRILIVDDDVQVQKTMAAILELDGYAVSTLGDGASVLATVATLKPSLVMMDVNLGGLNGLDVAKQLKQHPVLGHTPLMVMSGLAYGDVVRRAQGIGAEAFIVKPIEIKVLRSKVAEVLAKAGLGKAE